MIYRGHARSDHETVKSKAWRGRVKRRAGRNLRPSRCPVGQIFAGPPFIEIAAQDKWASALSSFGKQMFHLQDAIPPAQTQMRRTNAEFLSLTRNARQHGPPRFQPRQIKGLELMDAKRVAKQDGVPVMPDRRCIGIGIECDPPILPHHRQRQRGRSWRKSLVGLLKEHDVGVHQAQHPENAFRVAPPVEPDGLSDVPAYNAKGALHSKGPNRRATGANNRTCQAGGAANGVERLKSASSMFST